VTASAAAPFAELPRMIADIRSGLEQAAELINDVISGTTTVLGELPRHVFGPILDDVARLRVMLDATVTVLRRSLDQAGDPDALRATGSAWATDIGGPVSSFAGFASEIRVRADDYWKGDAADNYRDILLPQRFALTEIKTACDEIDAALNAFANAIFDFWVPVSDALVSLAAGLATAAIAAKLAPTAPWAAASAAGLLVIVGAFVTAQVESFFDILNKANTLDTELEARLSNNTKFPGGEWPTSTSDLSDGSITDGDDTDWHIK
jgi:hypothetical protein